MKIGVDNNNSDSLAARKQFTKMLVNKERHLQYYCKCQLVEKVRFGLTPRRAFAFPKEKIAASKENPLKELLCVSSPGRNFFSSISR